MRLSGGRRAFLGLLILDLCVCLDGLVATSADGAVDGTEDLVITLPRKAHYQLSQLSHDPLYLAKTANVRPLVTTANNTVVFVAFDTLKDYKIALLRKLVEVSPYPIVVGYDVGDGEAVPQEQLAMLKVALEGAVYEAQIVHMSYPTLLSKYGEKISNYSGRSQTNPAKLGVMDWFNSSRYSYLWHLENDVWAPGLDTIISDWRTQRTDLISMGGPGLPFWAQEQDWRIGDRSKLPHPPFVPFAQCNPSVFRMSKLFARSVLQSIQDSNTTNHHELWFPYVVQKWGLSWQSLQARSRVSHVYLNFNFGQKSPCLDELQPNNSILVAHPVKCVKRDQERSNASELALPEEEEWGGE